MQSSAILELYREFHNKHQSLRYIQVLSPGFFPLPHTDYLANLQVSISYTEKRGLRFLKTNLTLDWLEVLFIEKNYLFTLLKIQFKQQKNSVSCERTMNPILLLYVFKKSLMPLNLCRQNFALIICLLKHTHVPQYSSTPSHPTSVRQNSCKFETLTKRNTVRQLLTSYFDFYVHCGLTR